MANSPIFITGVYRSGTTLPSKILGAHSALRVTVDSINFFRFYRGRFEPVAERYEEIVEEVHKRLEKRFSIVVPKDAVLGRLRQKNRIELVDVYDALMVETFCEGRDDLRWGEKSVLQWTNIPLFLSMFPEGKAIHILRDPRDVLASYKNFTIEPKYRYLDAVFACLHSMHWAASLGTTLSPKSYRIFRHEDVIGDPERFAREACEFFGLPYEDTMIAPENFTGHLGEPWKSNTAFADADDARITTRSEGRWRSELDDFEICFAESIIGDLLSRFGYEPSGATIDAAGWNELWRCVRATPLLQDRLSHWWKTGEGAEAYPSDPLDPKNWAAGSSASGAPDSP